MKKFIAVFLSLCLITVSFGFVERVEACGPWFPPAPWQVEFEDTNRIFFMTPPRILPTQRERDNLGITNERMRIRTGLYYNETPLRNIYYAEIYAYWSEVFFSDCGMYIVTMRNILGGFRQGNAGIGLMNFYNNGVLVKSYYVDDLIEHPDSIPVTTAGSFWKVEPRSAFDHSGNFDPQEKTLRIVTIEGRIFIFDITSGEISSYAYNYELAEYWYWFRQVVEQECPTAKTNLGRLYKSYNDFGLAIYWIWRAANQGYVRAQTYLAIMYSEGLGTRQSYEQAIYWFRQAAEQGSTYAQEWLDYLQASNRI